MKMTKTQQEVYDDLMKLLKQRGRAWLLGWLLGVIISQSQHDPALRVMIRRKVNDDE